MPIHFWRIHSEPGPLSFSKLDRRENANGLVLKHRRLTFRLGVEIPSSAIIRLCQTGVVNQAAVLSPPIARRILSFSIREYNVLGLIPSTVAAP